MLKLKKKNLLSGTAVVNGTPYPCAANAKEYTGQYRAELIHAIEVTIMHHTRYPRRNELAWDP